MVKLADRSTTPVAPGIVPSSISEPIAGIPAATRRKSQYDSSTSRTLSGIATSGPKRSRPVRPGQATGSARPPSGEPIESGSTSKTVTSCQGRAETLQSVRSMKRLRRATTAAPHPLSTSSRYSASSSRDRRIQAATLPVGWSAKVSAASPRPSSSTS